MKWKKAMRVSRLDSLVAELCADGVVYKPLGELGDFYGGLTGKSKEDFIDGNTKFITYMNVFNNLEVNIEISDKVKVGETERQRTVKQGDILFTGSSETPGECGMASVLTRETCEPLYLNSFCFGLRLHDTSLLLPGFSKYLFRSKDLRKQITRTASGVTRFNVSKEKMKKVRIPLPPLEVQREVVRILDNFTEFTVELNSELSAELIARKKQYNYYRDKLLTFGDDVPMVTLGEIADYRRGSFPQPYGNREWYDGESAMPFVQVADVASAGMRLVKNTKQQISKLAQAMSVFVPSDTVIVTLQGSIGRVAITQYDSYVDRTLAIFQKYKIEMNKKYFAYQLERKFGIEKETARGSTLKTITKEEFTKFEIPLPSIAEQARIVSILDRFNALTTDISSGLPAEIAARQKQYEYYRDKLLTFKENA